MSSANQAVALRTVPMAHQRAAHDKMQPSRVGALFMDMGTGKSLVVMMLAAARADRIDRVVWCCPVSLMRNTARQIAEHTRSAPEDICRFDDKITDASLPSSFWVIVGLESIGGSDRVTMAFNALVDNRTMLVVDESSYIKGHRSKRTRRLTLIGQRARYRMVLNGTPISQGIEDLYAQMMFLSEKILGYRSWYSFQRAHLEWSEKYRDKIDRRRGEDHLSACIAPYVYQVTKDECLDLPEKLPAASRYVGLTPAQKTLYKEAKTRFEEEMMGLEDEDMAGVVIYRLFGALQTIANGVVPAGFEGHGESIPTYKTDELASVVSQLEDRHIVVWCRYQTNVPQITEALAHCCPERAVHPYYGELNEGARDRNLQRWIDTGGVFLATQSCGGYGLNDLVRARYAVYFGNSFKYSERLQAEDRLHRPGQKHNVSFIDIWTDCGIEERIESALRKKGNALRDFRAELDAARHRGKGAVNDILRAL